MAVGEAVHFIVRTHLGFFNLYNSILLPFWVFTQILIQTQHIHTNLTIKTYISSNKRDKTKFQSATLSPTIRDNHEFYLILDV